MTPENISGFYDQFFNEPSNNSQFAIMHRMESHSSSEENFFRFFQQDSPISITDSPPSHVMVKEEEQVMTSESQQPLEEFSSVVEVGGPGRRQKLKGRCNCRKNECQNNYCECFRLGRMCTERCGCRKCRHSKYNRRIFCNIEEFSDRLYDLKHNIQKK